MTRAQWIILARLDRQPGLSQNEMAAICEVEPITVGRLIDRLEARGLVERRADPADRRIRRLHLLPAAKPILEEIKRYKDELKPELLDGLDPLALDGIHRCASVHQNQSDAGARSENRNGRGVSHDRHQHRHSSIRRRDPSRAVGLQDYISRLRNDRGFLRRVLMIGGVALVAAISLVVYLMGGRYVSTDDSYVHANKLMVSTDVSGLVKTSMCMKASM